MKFACSTRVKAPNFKNTTSGDGLYLYDSASSKLPRRGMVDDREVEGGSQKETKNSQSVLTCRSFSYDGTLNVRTIRKRFLQEELASRFLDSGISILGVQEHRIVHGEPIKIERYGKCRLITVSAWRNSGGSSCGGVGVMVTEKASNSISLLNC